jgi:hypothetical protein
MDPNIPESLIAQKRIEPYSICDICRRHSSDLAYGACTECRAKYNITNVAPAPAWKKLLMPWRHK